GHGRKKSPTPAVTAPGKPAAILATAGDAEIVVSWVPPTTGSAASAFKIFRSESDTIIPVGDPLDTADGDAIQYTDAAVVNFTPYYYVVVAANEKGDGPPSDVAGATPAAGLPGTPADFAATAGDASVGLAWSAPGNGG